MSNESPPLAKIGSPHEICPGLHPPDLDHPEPARPALSWLVQFRTAGFRLVRRLDKRLLGLALVALVAFPVWRAISSRAKTTEVVPAEPAAAPVPVALVTRQDLYTELHYYAEFRPYLEDELHAKVSGYVQNMYVDFGDHVKKGQILATLEVPELSAELDAAKAAQTKAEADYTDARLIYTRLTEVDKAHPNLVAQQDLDNAESKYLMTKAAIAAAQADVEKYQTLVGYTNIIAPFDGVITWRYADPGALIQAGTSSDTQSMPLVRISDNYLLRMDFPVSLDYVKDIHDGDRVEVRVDSLGGKTLTGRIRRFTDKVQEDTRKMITEIEVPNPDLTLVPGMYAMATLKVQKRPNALAIPIQAIPPGQTSSVYVVNKQNEIEERHVKLGIDTPTQYEVLSGLKAGDMVLLGSRSRVAPGQKVQPKLTDNLAAD